MPARHPFGLRKEAKLFLFLSIFSKTNMLYLHRGNILRHGKAERVYVPCRQEPWCMRSVRMISVAFDYVFDCQYVVWIMF